MLTIINMRDADACFSGNMNAQGTLEAVRWINGPLKATLVGMGAQQIDRSFTELFNMTLVGTSGRAASSSPRHSARPVRRGRRARPVLPVRRALRARLVLPVRRGRMVRVRAGSGRSQ